MVVVDAVLKRLDALEASTASEDRQAVAILSQRGVTTEYRERLGALVATRCGTFRGELWCFGRGSEPFGGHS